MSASYPSAVLKSTRLALAVAGAFLDFQIRGRPRQKNQALWTHRWARKMAAAIGMKIEATGPVPASGLLVCNHVSYLDIIALAAVCPMAFVSKADVRDWPVFGRLAHYAGTIFIRRERKFDVSRVNPMIEARLGEGLVVTLFPEGTSSDGNAVLPFKSSLLDPAIHHPVRAAWIGYTVRNGDPARDVAYWGDMVFGPHLLKLLTRGEIQCRIVFAPEPLCSPDRKELARQLHRTVTELRASNRGAPTAR